MKRILLIGLAILAISGQARAGSIAAKATGFSVAGVTTLSTSSSLNVSTGNIVVITCHFFAGSATISASDSDGNMYTASPDGALSTTGVVLAQFYRVMTSNSATLTPQCNYTGAVTYTGIDAILISGNATVSPLDAHTFGVQTGSASFTSSSFNAAANDIIVAGAAWNQISLTCTAGTNFTIQNTETGGVGCDASWIPGTAQTSVTASMSINGTQNGIIGVLAFKNGGPASYFMSPSGNDTNPGTSGSPWLTPTHNLNCGDTITAVAGTYAYSSFQQAQWGTVTCAAANNVAWVKCATFDACKITAPIDNNGMYLTQSYWGVQGFEVTTSGNGACFVVQTNVAGPALHHILFANDIANGCGDGGFAVFPRSSTSNDYIAIVGVIAYNAAQGNANCFSGISILQPNAQDTLPGTHLYIAGNFTWANVDPNPCNGGTPTDGQGITLDSISGLTSYAQQIVVDNNISLFNGRNGLSISAGTGNTSARIYARHNTFYGNNTDNNQTNTWCGEMMFANTVLSEAYWNLPRTASATACNGNPNFALYVANGNANDHVYSNYAFGVGGNNTGNSGAFTFGPNNTLGTDPVFVSTTQPGAPSCSGKLNTVDCMSTVIANFTPTVAAAKRYGYQIPSAISVYDPLFPQWLCNVSLPAGLVTQGCLAGTGISGATVSEGQFR